MAASAMPSLDHTFGVHSTIIPCDRSHLLGRRMTVDLPPRPTELRDVKSPLRRPPADGSNEFASFAAQLAARNEKRRAGGASAAPPPSVDHDGDREEATGHSLSSLLASHSAAAIGGGVLVLVTVSVAVLVFWDLPFQASTLLPSNRIEQTKADIPAGAPPAAAPPASPRTAASPPLVPSRTAASAPPVTSPLPAAPPPTAKELVKSTAEPSSAPLTPDEIRELQGRLKGAGFNPGAIDGVLGRQTRSALRDYAQARSLPNADATRDLLVRLNAEPPKPRPALEPAVSSSPPQSAVSNSDLVASAAEMPESRKTMCTVDFGPWPTDRTDQAKAIQILLRDLGFYSGTTYGTVGPATRAAIHKFQLAADEAETGEPSEMLFESLKKKCASAAP
jgi:peptidoglycan hydrolase-like protein with peptidoglycan-binding domain